jgi:hypothetical protein
MEEKIYVKDDDLYTRMVDEIYAVLGLTGACREIENWGAGIEGMHKEERAGLFNDLSDHARSLHRLFQERFTDVPGGEGKAKDEEVIS